MEEFKRTLILFRAKCDNVCDIYKSSALDNYKCLYKAFKPFEIFPFMLLNISFVILKNV